MADKLKNTAVDTEVPAEQVIEEPVVIPMEKAVASVVDQPTMAQVMDLLNAQAEELSTLRASVNQSKLTAVENAKKPVGLPTAYLKVLNGKVVTSWKSEKPEFLYHPNNPEVPIGEVLKATYFFIDGTNSGPIQQVEFTRNIDLVKGEILEGLKGLKDSEVQEVTLHFTEFVTTDADLRKNFVLPEDLKINKNYLNP